MVVSSYNTQMGKFNIDAMTLVYRRIYMYAAKDSPRKKFVFRDSPWFHRGDRKSEVSLDISIKPQNATTPLYGIVEVRYSWTL